MEGQEPTQPAEGQTPAEQTAQNPEPKVYDEAYVKSLRTENASYRTKLRDFEKAEDDRRAAQMSELEKAQKAATDAENRATATETRLAKRDALDALKAANIVDPDLAYLAIKDGIKMENGEPANISELVTQFVAERPAMVKAVEAAKPTAPATKSTNPAPTASQKASGRADRF